MNSPGTGGRLRLSLLSVNYDVQFCKFCIQYWYTDIHSRSPYDYTSAHDSYSMNSIFKI